MKTQSLWILLMFIILQHISITGSYAQTNVSGSITSSSTWKKVDGPFIIGNNVTVEESTTLTIEPGVVVKHDGSDFQDMLTINGSIIAQGTVSDPIIFTDYKDDDHGGDTNGDGTASSPEREDWRGINIQSDAYAVFLHCKFRFGGDIDQGHAALSIHSDSTFVQNNEFENCGKALTVVGNISPQIRDNSFIQNTYPASISLGADPTFSGNVLTDNDFDALRLEAIEYENEGDNFTLIQRDFGGYTNISYIAFKVNIGTGVSLTIEPGITLKHQGYHFRNMLEVAGTIMAEGTVENPIVFTGITDDEYGGDSNNDGSATLPEREDWKGVYLLPGSKGRMSHCLFRYGGDRSQGLGSACLTVTAGDVIVDDCTFDNCGKALSVVGAISPAIRYNEFSNNSLPMAVSLDAAPIFDGNHLHTNNDIIGVWLEPLDYGESGTYTLEKINFAGFEDVSYVTNELTIESDVTLVIEPGVILKHSGATFDDMMNIKGTLIAMGTTTDPIVFTDVNDDAYGDDTNNDGLATSPDKGDWGSVFLEENSTGVISHCTFRYGGDEAKGRAALIVNGDDIIVQYNDFEYNEKALTANGIITPVIRHNTFKENKFPLGLSLGTLPQLSHNILIDNERHGIWIEPFDYDESGINYQLNKLNFGGIINPSFITRELTIGAGVSLTISPGITFKHDGYDSQDLLNIEGTLISDGTAYDPIVFTDIADDQYGGDSNNDGQSTFSHNGDWTSVILFSGSSSSFLHSYFRFGGRSNKGGLRVASNCSIEHCQFYKNETGLKIAAGGNSDLDSCRFVNNGFGILKSGGTVSITNSNLMENTNKAINNQTTSLLSATGNWWGDASGPLHHENPGGTGDPVSDYVIYDPFKTAYILDSIPPANNDLAVVAIDAPISGCGLRTDESVVMTILNKGLSSQSNFVVGCLLDGELIVEETVSTTIPAGESYQYTFTETLDLTSLGNFPIACYTALSTEERIHNDTLIRDINVLPELTTEITGKTFMCEGEVDTLSAINGTSYLWSNGQGGASIEISPAVTTTYTVTITNGLACTAEASFTVEILPMPTVPLVSTSGALTFCQGESVILTSNITENIEWSTGETSASIEVVETGIYTVQHTGLNGCLSKSDPINVFAIQPPTISLSEDPIICLGESVELHIDNSTGILWSTGATGSSITVAPTETTQYIVDANAEGCVFSDTLDIEVISADPPAIPGNLIPSENTQLVQLPVNFNWQPSEHATHYDLYYWKDGFVQPPIPQKEDIQTIATSTNRLNYNDAYQWQVVAKNACHETAGPILHFTTDGLPDITVTDLAFSPNVSAGNSIQMSWRINNIGDGSTGARQWREYVYLSTDLDLRKQDDLLLKTFNNENFLSAGDSYDRIEQIILPNTITGTYYIFVIADHIDAFCTTPACTLRGAHGGYRMKERDEQNNFQYDQITIYPPYGIDLKMGDIGAPTAAFGGDTISVTYKVENIGAADMPKLPRIDKIFLSRSPLVLQSQKQIANIEIDTSLQADNSHVFTAQAALPLNAFGKYYIFVHTDSDNYVYENGLDYNNLSASLDSINVTLNPPADLLPTGLNSLPTFESGRSAVFDWKVINQGIKAPYFERWEDHIYISKEEIFEKDSSIFIGSILHEQGDTLDNGESYVDTLYSYIPDGIEGDYYVYVHVDANEWIFEYNKDPNNIKRSDATVNISLPTMPDFVISDIEAPESIFSNQQFEIKWTTENVGAGNAYERWTDRVYVSESPVFEEGLATFLGESTKILNSISGESYNDSIVVRLPLKMTDDPFYFHVFADYNNDVYEHDNEHNNHAVHTSFGGVPTSLNKLYSDLKIDSFIVPELAIAGEAIDIEWQIENIGDVITTKDFWLDQVFLSADSEFDLYEDHQLVKQIYYTELSPGDHYRRSHRKIIPRHLEGDMYLILLVDKKEKLENEINISNNSLVIPIEIVGSAIPDLTVIDLNGPDEIYAGSKMTVDYTIQNIGEERDSCHWVDKIYISNSSDLTDIQNFEVSDSVQLMELTLNKSYTDDIEIVIPFWLEGNYYLVVKTGFGLYESDKKENNTSSYPIHILAPRDSDLEITATSSISDHYFGDIVPLDYSITNVGIDTAAGFIRTAINYSVDEQFVNSDDPLLNYIHEYIDLAPGESLDGTLRGIPRYMQAGEYHSILQTNTTRNPLEENFENNEDISTSDFNLDARSLTLDVLETETLFGSPLFYKVNVDAGLDLLITQTSDTTNGYNQILVAHERNPSIASFDFKNEEEGIAHQLYIPDTKEGDYYIQIKSNNFTFPVQEISILAQALPFSVLSASPNIVGQGAVTTLVEGAGFEDTDEVYLVDDSDQLVATGSIVNFISRMQMKVLWELNSVPVGNYNLVIEKPGNVTTSLSDAITVEEASQIDLQIIDLSANVLRLGKTGTIKFEFRNQSNVDLRFAMGDLVMPDGISIYNLEKSENIISRSELEADYEIEDYNNYSGYTHLPLLINNLGVGESSTISFNVRDYKRGFFEVSGRFVPLTVSEFLEANVETSFKAKEHILNNPESYGLTAESSGFLNLLQDKSLLIESLISSMIELGIVQEFETSDFLASCKICSDFDYDIPSSPAEKIYSSLTFAPNQSMLWEINHPYGEAGGPKGWDLYRSLGDIDITATPPEPLTIDIASRSSLNNFGHFLTTFSPGYDICWPFAIAEDELTGFDPSKFVLDDELFRLHNPMYGGHFSIDMSHDTLFICFNAASPGLGQDGFPGNHGQPGEDGGKGGQGGIGSGGTAAGSGGAGGNGGHGVGDGPGGNGGNGGPGGPGGPGGGGPGGPGGGGGQGTPSGSGGGGGFGPGGPGSPGGSGSGSSSSSGGGSNFSLCANEIDIPKLCSTPSRTLGCFSSYYNIINLITGAALGPIGFVRLVVGIASCATGNFYFNVAACATGSPFGCASAACKMLPVISSCDPNEIHGPRGEGDEHWVSDKEELAYTIFFENDPDFATAAAQRVVVRQYLDESLDPATFRLRDFGFGEFKFDVADNQLSFTQRLDLPDSTGIDLDVTAGLDVTDNSIFWIFQSIDPETGLSPIDPFAGFLPVNDSLLASGEGFVNYTIKPKADTPTGTVINGQASIFFDSNLPIATNQVFNTVDSDEPDSSVTSASIGVDSVTIHLDIEASDGVLGSGLKSYDIFMSANEGPYELLVNDLEATSYSFIGEPNSQYAIYSVATDNVGNVENGPTLPDVVINLSGLVICNVPLEYIIDIDTIPGGTILAFDNVNFERGLLKSHDSLIVRAREFISFDAGFETDLGSYLDVGIGDCIYVPATPAFRYHNELVSGAGKANQFLSEVQFRMSHHTLNDQIALEYYLPHERHVELYFENTFGERIMQIDNKKKTQIGINRQVISTSDLNSGIYFLTLEIGKNHYRKKVFINK